MISGYSEIRINQLGGKLKKLTIIIINYNTKVLLLNCLKTLDTVNLPEDYSVNVIDNHSPDNSAASVNSEFPHIKLSPLEENRGFPYAANYGIKNNPSEYYLILNSDTEVKPAAIKEMLHFMSENPDLGAMTPFQLNKKNEPQLAWGAFPTITSEIGRKILQDSLDNGKSWARRKLLNRKKPFYVHWVAGSTMLLRGEALQKAGLFDEKFFIFFEDIDLCRRIIDSGWKIAVCPGIKVIHHRGEAAKTDSINASLHYRRSQGYFWRKYHNGFSCFLMEQYLLLKFRVELIKLFSKNILKREKTEKSGDQRSIIINAMETIRKSFEK